MLAVTSFESDSVQVEEAQKVEQKFDYKQVKDAIKNLMVAENVFARCAKHHFQRLLGDQIQRVDIDVHNPPEPWAGKPLWVTGASVTMTEGPDLDPRRLAETTEALAAGISKIRFGKKLVFMGALDVKIAEVSPGLFTFSLKQKWSLSDG